MAERDLWAIFRDHFKHHGHLERIENLAGIGRPDVNYCIRGVEGNIELKQVARWPARGGPLLIEHYTPQQRNWARARLNAGGRVYLLLGISQPRSYYLFSSAWSRVHLGIDATEAMADKAALVLGRRTFPEMPLLQALIGPWP